MRTRKEKVQFLKELSRGQKQLSDILPRDFLIIDHEEDHDLYHCKQLNRAFSKVEYEGFKQQAKSNITFILITRT